MPDDTTDRVDETVELWEDLSRELWEVQLLGGATLRMTAEELTNAFAREELPPQTRVRRQGSTAWRPLRATQNVPPPRSPRTNEDVVTERSPPALGAAAPLAPPPPMTAPPPLTAPPPMTAPPAVTAPPPPRLARPAPPPTPVAEMPPLSTEELAVVRPTSLSGKLVAVATLALGTGALLAAMSAKPASATGKHDASSAVTNSRPPPPMPPSAIPPSTQASAIPPSTQASASTAAPPLAATGAHVTAPPASAPSTPSAAPSEKESTKRITAPALPSAAARSKIDAAAPPPPARVADKGDDKRAMGSAKKRRALEPKKPSPSKGVSPKRSKTHATHRPAPPANAHR
jgi:hypothetical protein